ncbi:MAG TPA: bifunctional diguanylate cyclase/phosphodiesterase [Streptosporangiaceae bacterium]|nr:bifunctional diguanylate cyclase/phosphodiesterase [Streptosporangiaceae bacterium]
MSLPTAAWTTVGVLLTVLAALLLVRRYRQGDVACRWLAVGVVAWGAAFAAQGASAGDITPAVIQLTLTDLLALLGLPFLVVALLRMAPTARLAGTGWLADGGLVALALFAIGWIAVLRTAYGATGVGSGFFVVDLIHPVADLLVLGGTLTLALRAGPRGRTLYGALLAVTVGDFLAVQARASGMHPGAWPQVAWLVAICLLGLIGLLPATAPADTRRSGSDETATVIAITAAAVGGLVTLIFALVTWGHSGSLALVAGALLILAVAARVASLLRQAAVASALVEQVGTQFEQLADRTSDVVVLCDEAGLIQYASKAVADFGYRPDGLTGTWLPDLVHPDDLAAVLRAAATARRGGAAAQAGAAQLGCRIRSSDGTWRHVQGTVSRYSATGPALLLVTARDISDQIALRQQVAQLTFHDGLTGLPNRSYVEERAKDLLTGRRGQPSQPGRTGAIFVDLDGFTAINDSVGHGAGDLVLAQAGLRLRGLAPAHDTVARWGGDEFAVLVEDAASPREVVDLAQALTDAIAAEPFDVAGRQLSITASVGVAFAESDQGEHLLRNADLAMSRAKDAGGGRVEVFAAHMHADVIRRIELVSALRAAIDDDGLGIEYQPVVELSTSRVASVEALVRWTRDGERVEPAEFLGIAEDSGLIVPLGAWVLGQACRQVVSWRRSGWLVGLSVNFSLRQVSMPDFAEMVLTALDDSGLPRSALTLEVTERVLIEIGPPIMDGLVRLRQLGVRLAIDDFGTGYASLAYLRELPVDIIKIDPSFVAGLGTDGTLAMLTRTVVQVGHDLGIEIVAEGIERPEQLELLRAMGCGLGQGFLVARPMTAQRLESLAVFDGRGPASLSPVAPPFSSSPGSAGSPSADPAGAPPAAAPATGL